MFDKAFETNPNTNGLIFHTDQGYQYQHYSTTKRLLEHNIIQSMSRKGNSIDNGRMESFFGIIKSEMFCGQEKNYRSVKELKKAIDDYIHYYNNERIKLTLKGLTPAQYRNQSSN